MKFSIIQQQIKENSIYADNLDNIAVSLQILQILPFNQSIKTISNFPIGEISKSINNMLILSNLIKRISINKILLIYLFKIKFYVQERHFQVNFMIQKINSIINITSQFIVNLARLSQNHQMNSCVNLRSKDMIVCCTRINLKSQKQADCCAERGSQHLCLIQPIFFLSSIIIIITIYSKYSTIFIKVDSKQYKQVRIHQTMISLLMIKFSQAYSSFRINKDMQLILNYKNLQNHQNLKDDVWYTFLVLLYLENQFSQSKISWQLVYQKGISYLKQNGIDYKQKKIEQIIL
ncbi:unnamed protein product [Paramecium octaurelia]|uniref:Transmembrane protein n=1 Tax=Paramecium octaurelia TaxID=43137 RepID=A0A8S1YNE8_PAROT|nr:unnamed protein product [Paramecium octaurelia]